MKTFLAILILSALASAATVTSITCSGQTATVNATAHGLIASQGFSLSGTAATFNGTASTVSANSFTFVLPAGTACSGFTSGYTAVVAAKQIIDIGATPNPLAPGGPTVTLTYLGWYTTVYPTALCTSAGVPIPPLTTCPVSQYTCDQSSGTSCVLGWHDGGTAKSSHLSCRHFSIYGEQWGGHTVQRHASGIRGIPAGGRLFLEWQRVGESLGEL